MSEKDQRRRDRPSKLSVISPSISVPSQMQKSTFPSLPVVKSWQENNDQPLLPVSPDVSRPAKITLPQVSVQSAPVEKQSKDAPSKSSETNALSPIAPAQLTPGNMMNSGGAALRKMPPHSPLNKAKSQAVISTLTKPPNMGSLKRSSPVPNSQTLITDRTAQWDNKAKKAPTLTIRQALAPVGVSVSGILSRQTDKSSTLPSSQPYTLQSFKGHTTMPDPIL